MRVINTVFILNKRPGALKFTRSKNDIHETKCGHNYIQLSVLHGYFGLQLNNFYPIKGRDGVY